MSDPTGTTTASSTPAAVTAQPAATAASSTPADAAPAEVTPLHRNEWPLWEVFVRSSRGLSHVHAGSLHAPDADMAVRNARDLYTRRNEGVSLWVVRSEDIVASDPDNKAWFFESSQGKNYRHATYYTKSEGVKHL